MNDRQGSGTARPESTRSTDPAMLGIYLNDHLMGTTTGVERVCHLVRSVRGSALAGVLGPVAEIVQDRTSLLGIMRDLRIPVRRYKACAGWTAEKVARLKSNGRLARRSPLSTFLELEMLRLAVEGIVVPGRAIRLAKIAAAEVALDEQARLQRGRGQRSGVLGGMGRRPSLAMGTIPTGLLQGAATTECGVSMGATVNSTLSSVRSQAAGRNEAQPDPTARSFASARGTALPERRTGRVVRQTSGPSERCQQSVPNHRR
ncbi:hypothetical protein ACFYXM_33775 [Streptomyces sp. NPDC002476]|uniref:hypothetical protein n=1 Tax=Streptomyces sp. NPDC002476 TaxID=3364648 RepID=UPI0036C34DAB